MFTSIAKLLEVFLVYSIIEEGGSAADVSLLFCLVPYAKMWL